MRESIMKKWKKGRERRKTFHLRRQDIASVVETCNKFLNYAPVRGETGSVSKFK